MQRRNLIETALADKIESLQRVSRQEEGSLREKLANHYASRSEFKPPKQAPNITGICFVVSMMVSLAIEGYFILIPSYFIDHTGQWTSLFYVAQFTITWLFLEAAGNWWLTFYDIENRVTKETKQLNFPNQTETPPGWRTCMTCQLDAPPRSHHCTLCNHCILKRDHHCFFTGSCVGYHNQRHFYVFCIYIVLAAGSAVFFQVAYLNDRIPMFTDAAVFYIPGVAVWQLLTGAVHILPVIILLHFYLTVFSFGCALFFLVWESLLIWRGQTSYEAWKNIMVYSQSSVCSNIDSVFGSFPNMLLCLLVPVRVTSPGDGIKWKIEPKPEKGH